jgi:hypothetical protein
MPRNRFYLTGHNKLGRLYFQYYPNDQPSLINFTKMTYSGFISNSGLQTLEKYNRTYNFAASPLSKSAINLENSDGSTTCSTTYCGNVTCANCCFSTNESKSNCGYTCGCCPGGGTSCSDCGGCYS